MIIAVKGLKGGNFDPLVHWYELIWVNSDTLLDLIHQELEPYQLADTLNVLKVGFYSGMVDVVAICARLFIKLASKILDSVGGHLAGEAWDWFIEQNLSSKRKQFNQLDSPGSYTNKYVGAETINKTGANSPDDEPGLAAALYALKRHPNLVEQEIASVLLQFGRNNYMELLTHHLRQALHDKVEYLQVLQDLFISGAIHPETQLSKDALLYSGVHDFVLELALRQAEYDGVNSIDERVQALVYLSELWQNHTAFIDDKQGVQQSLLNLFKKLSRDADKIIRTIMIEHLFILLQKFALEHHGSAPLIYK